VEVLGDNEREAKLLVFLNMIEKCALILNLG
jgi:hypothetical protein